MDTFSGNNATLTKPNAGVLEKLVKEYREPKSAINSQIAIQVLLLA
jgi:hypothetical protein